MCFKNQIDIVEDDLGFKPETCTTHYEYVRYLGRTLLKHLKLFIFQTYLHKSTEIFVFSFQLSNKTPIKQAIFIGNNIHFYVLSHFCLHYKNYQQDDPIQCFIPFF